MICLSELYDVIVKEEYYTCTHPFSETYSGKPISYAGNIAHGNSKEKRWHYESA